MKNICFILTTRGNYAKTKKLIELVRQDEQMVAQVVANDKAFTNPDVPINFFVKGGNHDAIGQSAALMASECTSAFRMLRPDILALIADRYEVLSAAMVANCMNIPIAHIEGGEESGTIDETFRHAVTKLSHIHFPATEKAAERIKKLGEDPDTVFTVGATSFDAIPENIKQDGHEPYIVVILHPVATQTSMVNATNIVEVFTAIRDFEMKTIWISSNYDANYYGLNELFSTMDEVSHIETSRGYKFEDFMALVKNSACVVGNSSCGVRETSYLGVPSVDIGPRQNGREHGINVRHVDYNKGEIMEAINEQIKVGSYEKSHLYGDGKASQRILEILKSFRPQVQKRLYY